MKLRINYIDNLRTIMIIVVFMSPWFINDMYTETINFKKKKATTFIKLTFGNK